MSLSPGDLIYTGTPGSTKKMNPGDIVRVEIEDVAAPEHIMRCESSLSRDVRKRNPHVRAL
jgi:2-keto-4-pentenoate hydratase/2-oxohepta-3-ene-1,7-dioic acid hydratase in catechol pathway